MNNKHVGVSRLYITFSKGIPTTKLVVRGIANRGDAQELEREFSRLERTFQNTKKFLNLNSMLYLGDNIYMTNLLLLI